MQYRVVYNLYYYYNLIDTKLCVVWVLNLTVG